MNLYQLGQLKNNLPEIKPGDTVRVFEKIMGESKKKSQVFEGVLISKKHGKGINATFTLRAILEGVGVEKTYPLHSPLIEKIEIIKKGKVRRAKLYYLREKSQKKIRKKLKAQIVKKKEEPKEEKGKEEEKKQEKKLGEKKEEKKGEEKERKKEKNEKSENKNETKKESQK